MDKLLARNSNGLTSADKARLGCLEHRLKISDVMEIAYPLGAPGMNQAAVCRNRLRFRGILEEAINKGTLKAEKDADRQVVEQAPEDGWAVPFNTPKPQTEGEDREDLYQRTAPRARTIVGATWLKRDDVETWLKSINEWPPAPIDGLRRWWPELDEAAIATGRKNAKTGAASKLTRAEKNAERRRLIKPFLDAALDAYKNRNECRDNISAAARFAISQNESDAKRDGITLNVLRKAIRAALLQANKKA